jgi:RNase P/RNase MRP subunit p30
MSTTPPQQKTAPTAEHVMLDAVRRRLIAVHYGLAEATQADREARAWALQELMSLIRELTPYRIKRSETANVE